VVKYAILGPVTLGDCGRGGVLRGPRQVALLAFLLVNANRALSNDGLIDALWGDLGPRGAAKRLQAAIVRLRRALAPDDVGGESVLRTVAGGYLLAVGSGELDAEVFQRRVQEGRRALEAGDAQRGRDLFVEALRMWRGPALADVAYEEFAQPEVRRLEELRLAALESRVECELQLGEHGELIGDLEALVAAHPGRERLAAQLMLALYRCGRQGDALEIYARARTYLSGELGLEPGPALQALQAAILAQSPVLQPAADPPGLSAEASRPARLHAAALPTGVVTFLLTDIEGSTRLWEADPEAMAAALEVHDELIAGLVERHDGRLLKDKGEGDATLSVFARASNAIACATELQHALARDPRLDLRVRVALHSGEAQERDGDYFGPVLNRAARLRSKAAGGVTVVSQSTTELVRDRLPPDLALINVGSHELRGLSRPERIFELRPTPGGPADAWAVTAAPIMLPLPRSLHASPGSPFVGREAELARLGERWTGVRGGARSAVLIAGEAGIGKTRLAVELARAAHEQGALVLYGRCDEGLAVPYQPFVEALRPYAGTLGLDCLRAELGGLAPELARLLPELSGLGEPIRLDPESERFALFEATASLVEVATREQPALLVLEDLHWAANPTLLLLRHLIRSDRQLGVLLLCTYRETELEPGMPPAQLLADLHRDASVERLNLAGLDERAIAALLEATIGRSVGERASQLVRTLSLQTAGNPLFVRELLAHVAESGERLSQGIAAGRLEIPTGLRQVIGQRVARLCAPARHALSIAAVAGPMFSFVLIERVLDEATGALDALDEAVAAGLLSETGRGDYVFTHALVRQTIYEQLGAARRIRLHRQLGEALEELGADRHVEALAHHFAQAAPDGQGVKAAAYALIAGRGAAARLGYEEAVAHYERGLAALGLSGQPQEQQRCELLLALGEARWGAGELVEAREAFWEAAALAETLGQAAALARAALGFCDSSRFAVDTSTNRRLTSLLERAVLALGQEDSAWRAQLIGRLASCTDDARSTSVLARQALQMAERVADDATLADVLTSSRWATRGPDSLHDAFVVANDLVRAANEGADGPLRARARGWLLDLVLKLGDLDAVGRDDEAPQRLDGPQRERYFTWLVAMSRANRAHLRRRREQGRTLAQDPHANRFEPDRVDESLFALLQKAYSVLGTSERSHTAATAPRIRKPPELASSVTHPFCTLSAPESSVQRLQAANDVVALGDAAGDRELVLRGHIARIISLMELGDWVGADAEIALHARLTEELRDPVHLWYVPVFKATRALLHGRLADAERFAREALAIGRGTQPQNAAQLYAVQLFALRAEQGRLSEVEHALEEFDRRYPAAPVWRAASGFASAQLGRLEDAQRTFEALTANGAADIPRDADWISTVALLIRIGAGIGDMRRTGELGELLAPYAGRAVVVARGTVCLGPVTRFTGIAAATAGHSAKAIGYLAHALAMARRWNALPTIAAIQRELAEIEERCSLESADRRGDEHGSSEAPRRSLPAI
jgi:DNA-binding SARP family transcriptional activator/class 3 adenylate cyclase